MTDTKEENLQTLKILLWDMYTDEQLDAIKNGSQFPGGKLFEVILKTLKLRPIYVGPYPSGFGIGQEFLNGSWDGMVGELQRGVVDILDVKLVITEDRFKVINYGYPDQTAASAALSVGRSHFEAQDLMSCLFEFEKLVWACFALATIILVVFMTFSTCCLQRRGEKPWYMAFQDNLIGISASVMQRSFGDVSNQTKSLSNRIALAHFLFGMFIFANVFSSTITTNSLIPSPMDFIDSFEQLAKSKKRCPLFMKNGALSHAMKAMGPGSIGEKLISRYRYCEAKYPKLRTFGDEEFLREAAKGGMVPVHLVSALESQAESICRENPDLRIHISDERIFPINLALAYSRHMDKNLQKRITKLVGQLKTSGIIDYWDKLNSKPCPGKREAGNMDIARLNLPTLEYLFVSWVVGVTSAFLTLLLEFLISKCYKSAQREKRGRIGRLEMLQSP